MKFPFIIIIFRHGLFLGAGSGLSSFYGYFFPLFLLFNRKVYAWLGVTVIQSEAYKGMRLSRVRTIYYLGRLL